MLPTINRLSKTRQQQRNTLQIKVVICFKLASRLKCQIKKNCFCISIFVICLYFIHVILRKQVCWKKLVVFLVFLLISYIINVRIVDEIPVMEKWTNEKRYDFFTSSEFCFSIIVLWIRVPFYYIRTIHI